MSRNEVNNNDISRLGQLSFRRDFIGFMKEDDNDRLVNVINIMKLMEELIHSKAQNNDLSSEGLAGFFFLVTEELTRIRNGIYLNEKIFSEYEAVSGVELVDLYGTESIIKMMEKEKE
ncbi:TPA: hypothetical protein RQO04_003942 [Klebsiella oxytoca]|nr:hypothetical protein [Klebsiella oxytoca]HDX8773372.1 hypothetical protein [Klebsiella oxytoca]